MQDAISENLYKEAGTQLNIEYADSTATLVNAVKQLNDLREKGAITEKTYARALRKTYQEQDVMLLNWGSLLAHIQSFRDSWEDSFTNAIVDGARTGKFAFEDFANSVINDLARMAVQASITKPLFNAIFNTGDSAPVAAGAAPIAPHIGPNRASGGSVKTGTSYIVGENGPEIFTAGANGFITPNSTSSGRGLPSAASKVNINIHNNASGATATATSKKSSDGSFNIDVMIEQITNNINNNTLKGKGVAPVMEERYGLNPAAGMRI